MSSYGRNKDAVAHSDWISNDVVRQLANALTSHGVTTEAQSEDYHDFLSRAGVPVPGAAGRNHDVSACAAQNPLLRISMRMYALLRGPRSITFRKRANPP